VEGVRLLEEALAAGVPIHGAVIAADLERTARGASLREDLEKHAVPIEAVSARVFAPLADTDTPQGIVAVIEPRRWTVEDLKLDAASAVQVIDGVQDPGNVGTMVRTAAAFGVTATLALPGTVDLWNAKVVRSAMGALFSRPAFPVTWDALEGFLRSRDIPLWGADAAGQPLDERPSPERLAIAVGNEGNGLSSAVREAAEHLVAIPIASHVESLNVAVATGILLYHFRP